MADAPTHCSHGASMDDDCAYCEAVWLGDVTLPEMRRNIRQFQRWASSNPGLVQNPASVASLIDDLYKCVGRLSLEVEKLKVKNNE